MCDECAHEQPRCVAIERARNEQQVSLKPRFLHVFYLMMFDLPPSPHAWGSYACAFCASVLAPRGVPTSGVGLSGKPLVLACRSACAAR